MGHYENTFIGSFLYGLGIEIGASSADHPLVTGVDLLQQTPLDQSLADLLIKAPCYVSIIEFKRSENRDEKETCLKTSCCMWRKPTTSLARRLN